MLSGKEVQITFDGKTNEIINGASDWVYEEEFKVTQLYAWSPDGKKIAYLQFDESLVPDFSFTFLMNYIHELKLSNIRKLVKKFNH